MQTVLLALRPEHATAILAGHKTVELRRRKANMEPGDRIILYAACPQFFFMGACRVKNVTVGSPSQLYRRFGRDIGLTKRGFDEYLDGVEYGCAIRLGRIETWLNPVGLAAVRRVVPGFVVPQSYRRLSADEVMALEKLRY